MVERLNRADLTTQVIPFNLGKAILQGDETNNIALMPGDVVTVYSQKDIRVPVSRQTRLVSIEGEIASPRVYQLTAGETLRSLIMRAGGFTRRRMSTASSSAGRDPQASAREPGHRNVTPGDAVVREARATPPTVATTPRVPPRRGGQQRRNAGAAGAAEPHRAERPHRARADARCGLTRDARLPLENADRISVPPRPGFVTVAGAVVNSNAFVWRPGAPRPNTWRSPAPTRLPMPRTCSSSGPMAR